jgi:hypothetical protein
VKLWGLLALGLLLGVVLLLVYVTNVLEKAEDHLHDQTPD